MQNIDFRRFVAHKPNSATSIDTVAEPVNSGSTLRNILALFIIALLSFGSGYIVGNKRIKQPINAIEGDQSATQTTANVNNEDEAFTEKQDETAVTPATEEIEEDLQKKDSYLILAKIYREKAKAHKQGLILKHKNLPVFLTENGNKMKVYVGPIQGKTEAYNMLAKVKSVPVFKGAILYKK